MTQQIERWLLPDGVGEILPPHAERLEQLRRRILDLYGRWGYELVMPPLLEFTESLLTSTNRDLDLQTFKVTDQLSGRTMGIRADVTPQAARIDAHSLNRAGPVRLCYAEPVLHTRPSNALASRSPIQLGVECFGLPGLPADIEVISLMIETLRCAGISRCVLSLGHVEVFRGLSQRAVLEAGQTEMLLDILQRKAAVELDELVEKFRMDPLVANCCRQLLQLNGTPSVLLRARKVLSGIGEPVLAALSELETVVALFAQRYPEVDLHIDLAELPGYHYHNGIVFAACVEGAGAAVANGGRYDALCELFGRRRSATGFNADLKILSGLGELSPPKRGGIAVVTNDDPVQWQAIVELRAAGERVIAFPSLEVIDEACDRELRQESGAYVVRLRR